LKFEKRAAVADGPVDYLAVPQAQFGPQRQTLHEQFPLLWSAVSMIVFMT
jgi:hypothetical protein